MYAVPTCVRCIAAAVTVGTELLTVHADVALRGKQLHVRLTQQPMRRSCFNLGFHISAAFTLAIKGGVGAGVLLDGPVSATQPG